MGLGILDAGLRGCGLQGGGLQGCGLPGFGKEVLKTEVNEIEAAPSNWGEEHKKRWGLL